MKAVTGLVLLALASTAVGEDPEERKRARAEKLATMASHMSGHLRKVGGGHSEAPPASLMGGHARKDEQGLKAMGEPSTKKAGHAEKIRHVADKINEQHRRHMEWPMPHDLRTARSAQHSFADMKASKDGRKPSVGMNAKRKEPLDKLARHMSQHIDANAVRSAAAMGDPRTIKAAHDAIALASGHGAPVREKMDASHLKGMQHRLAHTRTHKLHQTDAGGDNSDPAEGEE